MGEAEPIRQPEFERLAGSDLIVIVPFSVPKVIVCDLRQSHESLPNVTSFHLSELIYEIEEDLEEASGESLINVAATLARFSELEKLVDTIVCKIGAKLDEERPDATPIRSVTTLGLYGSLAAFLKSPEFGKLGKAVIERAGDQLFSEFKDAIEEMLPTEDVLIQRVNDWELKSLITGKGALTLWQRPQDN